MAEHSKLHLWLNTLIAGIAIAVSAFSAFVSWKSYSINVETFVFSSSFTYDCPFMIGMSTKDKSVHSTIGLCWQVVISNQSSSRASIIYPEASMLSDDHSSEPLAPMLLDRKGTELSMPISFEGGEARTIVVLVSLPITDAFGKIVNDTIKSQAGGQFRTLADAAAVAAQAKMDVLGNPVSVSEFGRFGYVVTPSPRYQNTVVVLRLHSGRDKVFETQLTYPNDINIVFRASDTNQPKDR
jgi:hypothetical protein